MAARPNLSKCRATGRRETVFRLGVDSGKESCFTFFVRLQRSISRAYTLGELFTRPAPPSFFFGSIPFHLRSPECRQKKDRLFLYFVKICKQTEDIDQGFASYAKAQYSHENKKKCATVSIFAMEESRGRGPSFVFLASGSKISIVCLCTRRIIRPPWPPPAPLFSSNGPQPTSQVPAGKKASVPSFCREFQPDRRY